MTKMTVHVYTTIRVAVAVEALTHLEAMKKADDIVFSSGLMVDLTPKADDIIAAEYAEEVTGYLVDEEGDSEFANSRIYNADYQPDYKPTPDDSPNTVYTATFCGEAWINDHAIPVDDSRFEYLLTLNDLHEARRALSEGLDLDFLKDAKNAPQEVKDWQGPFEITIDYALTEAGYTVNKDGHGQFIAELDEFQLSLHDTEEKAWSACAEHLLKGK